MTALTLPKLVGSRQLVARLLEHIPTDLGDDEVIVHAETVVSAAPSFVDELYKEILVTRRAALLTVECASERLAFYLERSANARGVRDRLVVDRSPDYAARVQADLPEL
jgi:F420-0:gamma-glutamyl ligase